jgi:hypothetical protein
MDQLRRQGVPLRRGPRRDHLPVPGPGRNEVTILLGFTVAGYNLDRIRSYSAKQRAQQEAKPAQPKRRRGTWQDIIEPTGLTTRSDESPPT